MLKRLLLHSESMKKGCKITYLASDQGIFFEHNDSMKGIKHLNRYIIENIKIKRNSIHLLKWIV